MMTIVKYNDSKDIIVEFENGHRIKTRYSEFKNGSIKSPYDKSVFKVGYIGIGDYKVSIEGIHTIQYHYWYDMLKRCYDKRYTQKHGSYVDKYVCDEWHNFQNFGKWFDENYYETIGQRMELDKDILNKNNKIYSPQHCIFVPKRINTLFLKCDKVRGKYPIGVTERNNRFIARCSTLDKNNKLDRVVVGYYSNPIEAFYGYKEFKEKYIKQVAEEYKDRIPKVLYDAMYKYEVELKD